MGHEGHHHEEKEPLGFFASPLVNHSHPVHTHHPPSTHSSDIEASKPVDPHTATEVPFGNADCSLHDNPAFHRHAEATTSELFYDLFFVANLTTFTSLLEINDHKSLTAYIGFFSILWLTWYQVSLYDVRFSTDSVFERCAKAIHFGVMVGFAVIGAQWKPGQEIYDYKIYRAFGLILMVSRITLFLQYAVTLFYVRKYTKTIIPIGLVMGSTLLAAILYGALTPAFPKEKFYADGSLVAQKSEVYIAWYVIAICETILTVAVSCVFRIISFKGTHMVQRMSLLTLIILGEGIIVICKSISKIVKNEYLWTAAVVGQIIAAILIIYFLYMLYFDRMQEEHFGTIKQQLWSFSHFPLHVTLVLVLQGVSLLVIWLQALDSLQFTLNDLLLTVNGNYTNGDEFADALWHSAEVNVFDWVPKGVDANAAYVQASDAWWPLSDAYDALLVDGVPFSGDNQTAIDEYTNAFVNLTAACTQTIFDSLSVSVPKTKDKAAKAQKVGLDYLDDMYNKYYAVFSLVFQYVFIAGGLALIVTTFLGYLSLPAAQKRLSQYIRLGINLVFGVGLCLISTIKYTPSIRDNYMGSPWMVPTLCLCYFVCVVVNHISLPKKKAH